MPERDSVSAMSVYHEGGVTFDSGLPELSEPKSRELQIPVLRVLPTRAGPLHPMQNMGGG